LQPGRAFPIPPTSWAGHVVAHPRLTPGFCDVFPIDTGPTPYYFSEFSVPSQSRGDLHLLVRFVPSSKPRRPPVPIDPFSGLVRLRFDPRSPSTFSPRYVSRDGFNRLGVFLWWTVLLSRTITSVQTPHHYSIIGPYFRAFLLDLPSPSAHGRGASPERRQSPPFFRVTYFCSFYRTFVHPAPVPPHTPAVACRPGLFPFGSWGIVSPTFLKTHFFS